METSLDTLNVVWNEWKKKIAECNQLANLDQIRVDLLGKNGAITQELKKIKDYSIEKKREVGGILNIQRSEFEQLLEAKKQALETEIVLAKLKEDAVDVTLPVRPERDGKRHLLTQITDELQTYFQSHGFKIVSGPEIDSEYNNFEALNIPKHHPARQDQDTFLLKDIPGQLLRSHTSTIQIRTLSTLGVPVRAVSIGSCFRNDAVDATHSPMFHQIEIFVVEPGTTMAHLKWCLLDLLSFLFKMDLCTMAARHEAIPIRFRPSFFPFTEPSIEVDVCCIRKKGELKLDLNGDWLEVLGCGMIHPNVFKACGLETFENGDPVQGFAIGIGIERIAMLRYGITDIRHFYEGDIRWLDHYGRA